MFVNEARWLGKQLRRIVDERGETISIVNLGSQSLEFRQETQPLITELVFDPVSTQSSILHVDMQEDPGVDLQLDITTPDAERVLLEMNPDVVVASNILEHVEDLDAGVRLIRTLGLAGSLIIVTGPRHFPLHADPIDNGFRPTRSSLERLLAPLQLVSYARFWSPTALNAASQGRPIRRRARQWWLSERTASLRAQRQSRASVKLLMPVSAFGSIFRRPTGPVGTDIA